MQTNSIKSSTLSLSAALVASICSACVTDQDAASEGEGDVLEEAAQETGATVTSVTALPSFTSTPNIKAAMALLTNPTTVAVVRTVSGFQIYRCEMGTAAPEWRLRTPLTVLEASSDVQRPSLNRSRLSGLVASYHYRSDFGGMLSPTHLGTLGLANPPVNAPVWDFTFQGSSGLHREVMAGRLIAQDATSTANIPMFLLEVRGRAIDPGTPKAIAAASHVLRWNTRGGLAPAASTCTSGTLGQEHQAPYSTDYHFIATGA